MKAKKLKEILDRFTEQLDYIIEEKGEDFEIELRCNTYGLHGTFLSIPSKGYLSIGMIEDVLDEDDE